ncbi:coiled-coil domain-containing protein [Streptomyces hydrogenans]|uniref:coiled-coil domain-containing protein n=1 Tax=Streptomyces hydrogenans TaxID=1873719 RepID=UPI00381C44EA
MTMYIFSATSAEPEVAIELPGPAKAKEVLEERRKAAPTKSVSVKYARSGKTLATLPALREPTPAEMKKEHTMEQPDLDALFSATIAEVIAEQEADQEQPVKGKKKAAKKAKATKTEPVAEAEPVVEAAVEEESAPVVDEAVYGDGKGKFAANGRSLPSGTDKATAVALGQQIADILGEPVEITKTKTGNVIATVHPVTVIKKAPAVKEPALVEVTDSLLDEVAGLIEGKPKAKADKKLVAAKTTEAKDKAERAQVLALQAEQKKAALDKLQGELAALVTEAGTLATEAGAAAEEAAGATGGKTKLEEQATEALEAATGAIKRVNSLATAGKNPAVPARPATPRTPRTPRAVSTASSNITDFPAASVSGWHVRYEKGGKGADLVGGIFDGRVKWGLICREHSDRVFEMDRQSGDRTHLPAADWCTGKGCKNGVNREARLAGAPVTTPRATAPRGGTRALAESEQFGDRGWKRDDFFPQKGIELLAREVDGHREYALGCHAHNDVFEMDNRGQNRELRRDGGWCSTKGCQNA